MIYRVPTAWGLTKGRYSTPPLYSSSDLIPIFTWASSVYYTHDKLPFKKKKKKKKTGLCWCWHFCGEDSHDFIHGVKLGLLFCWNLCKAKKVRFDHCRSNIVLINYGKWSAVPLSGKSFCPCQAGCLEVFLSNAVPAYHLGLLWPVLSPAHPLWMSASHAKHC